jgi:hypothetical protein
LAYDRRFGYLPALLDQLQVPPASQLLVFSKTSCQRDRISPRTPRAIYFNDRVYVAWIPGAKLLEISGVDPKQGAVFYTIDQVASAKPQLVRRDQCLECHTSNQTLGVPGYLVRSYATDASGTVDITDGWSMVDHRTPFAQRWGGWYVGGADGGPNRGSSLSPAPTAQTPTLPAKMDLASLSDYLTPNSDVVALMVLEHQAEMQNYITHLQSSAVSNQATSEPGLIDEFVKYLLFANEAALTIPLQSKSPFITWFESQGPRDRRGRSLRQFDLGSRLFRYPCSYMIYSDAFDALPRSVRLHIYNRLWRMLTGADGDAALTAMPAATRRAVLEILIETKPDVPVGWRLE